MKVVIDGQELEKINLINHIFHLCLIVIIMMATVIFLKVKKVDSIEGFWDKILVEYCKGKTCMVLC
ncbi:MAG: hypothetical protein ABDH23_05115 [Endomicrobiia bacterium]